MMKKYNLNNSILFIIIIICSACHINDDNGSRVGTLPYYKDASFTPQWIEPGSTELNNFHQIPDFNLINQDGERITASNFEGKIYVTDFFFTTCPGICPRMTRNMMILQKEFKNDDDVMLLSHSVTPERDSISVLKEYAEDLDINSEKWHLVTGDRHHIYSLGRLHYFVEEDLGLESDVDEFLHTENFILVDQNRHIRGIYNGLNRVAIDQLIEDIFTLKRETAAL